MFCGSFSHVDDDPWSPRSYSSSSSSPPRRSRRKEKNPYANRGLDKFAAVLEDLEARREKIIAQMGEKDVFLVRFAHSSSRDWVPIVVKAGDQKKLKSDRAVEGKKLPVQHKSPVGSSGAAKEVVSAAASDGGMNKRFSWKEKNNDHQFMNMKRPSFYWSVVLIMILLCLVIFGRSFAIMCMCIWWYLVPTNTLIKGGDMNMRRSMKKSYGRGLSGKSLGGDLRALQSKMGQGRIIT